MVRWTRRLELEIPGPFLGPRDRASAKARQNPMLLTTQAVLPSFLRLLIWQCVRGNLPKEALILAVGNRFWMPICKFLTIKKYMYWLRYLGRGLGQPSCPMHMRLSRPTNSKSACFTSSRPYLVRMSAPKKHGSGSGLRQPISTPLETTPASRTDGTTRAPHRP